MLFAGRSPITMVVRRLMCHSIPVEAPMSHSTAEHARLDEERQKQVLWKKWGPYLSERQWGTVREDYSANGDAWNYFTHDQARFRAYRWGEDGLAGICDDQQLLCFALALWNGADPILKERLFGLTNSEGNHGEDVKEYYFYLDSTPTHSYMKYLYKYPQRAYPYDDLVGTNKKRTRNDLEYELLDTGAFDDDRYFDIFVEYAKAAAEDILIRITANNRGPEDASLHLLPTLWYRNTWSWVPGGVKPEMVALGNAEHPTIYAAHPNLGDYYLVSHTAAQLLFTENETNNERIFGLPNASPYVKDGIHNYVIHQQAFAVNPAQRGTKVSARYSLAIPARGSARVRLRLFSGDAQSLPENIRFDIASFDQTIDERRQEADAFYQTVIPQDATADEANVMRQALAGMLWTKQHYIYDVYSWINTDGASAQRPRNDAWVHLSTADIISMPDKWEYPWFAAWDLAFHTGALHIVDPDFAKNQLELIHKPWYMHPNGQIPAYEWNFSDVNPPVQGLAAWRIYTYDRSVTGTGDRRFLQRMFQKLMLNFTWWVNRKDALGNNIFEGGFLGLDNIGVFDRSSAIPEGGLLEQADGTSWMALYCLNMLEIALELSKEEPEYEEIGYKFYEHFIQIASAMDRMGVNEDELYDEDDGFYYDLLRLPDGHANRLKVRSLVGLLPIAASLVMTGEEYSRLPHFGQRSQWLAKRYPEVACNLTNIDQVGNGGNRMLAVITPEKLRRMLTRMLDPNEFLSEYGIRSLSKCYQSQSYKLSLQDRTFTVTYEPAESTTGMFGGNSNWRGPIWFPMNIILLYSLYRWYSYLGPDFKVECPTGSGKLMNLQEVSTEISHRLIRIFTRQNGARPVYGGSEKFQKDPYWKDLVLFYEYFHGDNGAGIGASHQTGWTGLVARLIQIVTSGAFILPDKAAKVASTSR
jgi:Glycosyl hydrolase family 63 C-terminal domain